jgi:hypothetical protein
LYHILLEVREEIVGQFLARQVIYGYEVSPLGDEEEMGGRIRKYWKYKCE